MIGDAQWVYGRQNTQLRAGPEGSEGVPKRSNAAERWGVVRKDEVKTESGRVVRKHPTDDASLQRDCDVSFFRASGAGGQHRNKVETAVRVVHRPSGLTVTATEHRSQHQNRQAAMKRIKERIERAQAPPKKARYETREPNSVKRRNKESNKRQKEKKQSRMKVKDY